MTNKAMTHMMKRMEDKLRELMGEEEFHKFSVELAKESFRKEVEGMADSDFKRFVTANFDDITAESDKPYVSLADALYVARESEK